MSFAKKKLLTLFQTLAYKTGEFTLASGQKSNYYINSKPILFSWEGMDLIGEVIGDLIKEFKIDRSHLVIGGVEVGAIPIACAVSRYTSDNYDYRDQQHIVNTFVVRKKIKEHGTQSLVEGYCKAKNDVLIVEDVITTGGSTLKAIKAVEEIGAKIVGIIALVDRKEKHLEEFDAYKNIYHPIFTIDDLKG